MGTAILHLLNNFVANICVFEGIKYLNEMEWKMPPNFFGKDLSFTSRSLKSTLKETIAKQKLRIFPYSVILSPKTYCEHKMAERKLNEKQHLC